MEWVIGGIVVLIGLCVWVNPCFFGHLPVAHFEADEEGIQRYTVECCRCHTLLEEKVY